MIGRDALLILDLGLDILDSVRRLHVERDGLARQRLYEDLHGVCSLFLMRIASDGLRVHFFLIYMTPNQYILFGILDQACVL